MSDIPLVPSEHAQPVADMLGTVAELRAATVNLAKMNRAGFWPIVAIEARLRGEAWVRELTDRVQSRARSAGMVENDLMRLAEAVLDRRMALPEGVEALEAA